MKKSILIVVLFIIISIILSVKFPKNVEALTCSEYVKDDVMNYYLYSPSNTSTKKPLIVWLHGLGSFGSSSGAFKSSGLLNVLNSWSLKEIDAYVLCPHDLDTKDKSWKDDVSKIDKLIENIIAKHNIDANNVVLVGHSRGGTGAQYVAYSLPNRFSKLVVLSGYNPTVDVSKIKIPTIGYVGDSDDGASIKYMKETFSKSFDVTVLANCGHGSVPKEAFYLDKNKDGESDLINWMFDGYTGNISKVDFFDEDITFEREYVSDGKTMPYALYTPSTASDSVQMPLIVWLHGSGERGVSEDTFFERGLPNVLNNWKLEGFNAYILCPHLAENGYSGGWTNPTSRENLEVLLDKFISEHNIDTDNIVITGHSLGGSGCQYMAHQMPDRFSKLVVLSGYYPSVDPFDIKIPTIGYVGTTAAGEDSRSVEYMKGTFASAFGQANSISLSTSHGGVPKAAFNKDDDKNGRSDLIEWMFEGYEVNVSSQIDFFDEDITYKYEYLQDEGGMKYGLFTPSTAEEATELPLVVWLHGASSMEYRTEGYLSSTGLAGCFRNWEETGIEGFNAYILCPYSFYETPWTNNTEKEQLRSLLDNIIEEKNIDRDNIVIIGHSSGANGAIYMTYNMPEYFSKCVLMSGFGFQGYCTAEEWSELGIETIAYTGNVNKGEFSYSVNPTKNEFEPTFGSENTFYIDEAGHSDLPEYALKRDSDNNNRSDMVEWLFDGYVVQGTGTGNRNTSFKDKNDGGDLLIGMAQFMCFIPDSVINLCQWMFLNDTPIEEEDKGHTIYYSPAAIFSGTIPAFDVNFITAKEDEKEIDNNYELYIQKEENNYYEAVVNDGTTNVSEAIYTNNLEEAKKHEGYYTYTTSHSEKLNLRSTTTVIYYEEIRDDQTVLCIEYFSNNSFIVGSDQHSYNYMKEEIPLTEEKVAEINSLNKYSSSALVLQSTIATFYNALRRIALVGLLSALVYIGIRIVLTSTSAKDKAKYKKMLKDWLIALCILFTLHYIMSITVTVVDHITEVVKASTIGANGEDVMMTKLRNDIANGNNWGEVLVQVVLYFVLAVYIIIFTIQYLRRTIYLAFLTVISPLITLTYPLDKIKDSKSQAFDMWIKDYIFFSLIQVVHLLIYYILVGSAIDLTDEKNWIFAIVAIGFLIPAEKIIKKMFGFEKSKSMGALAAGATGALVMNAINKITPKGGGKSSGASSGKSSGSANNIRTAANDTPITLGVGSGANGAASGNGTGGGSNTSSSGNNLKGAWAVTKKYGGKVLLGAGKGALKGAVGATGAMVGFAAGVAQGDISAALKGAVAGGAAGTSFAGAGINTVKGIPDAYKNAKNDIVNTWNTGAHGAEYAQSAREIREFKGTSTYKSLNDKYGEKLTDDKIDVMLKAGIKDKGTMSTVMEMGDMEKGIGYYNLAKACPDNIFYDNDKLKEYVGGYASKYGLNAKDTQTIIDNMKKFK